MIHLARARASGRRAERMMTTARSPRGRESGAAEVYNTYTHRSIHRSTTLPTSLDNTISLTTSTPHFHTTMSVPEIVLKTRQAASGQSGENAEVRQVTTTDDMHPDPSKSIKLPPNRQKLVDDVIAL
jgi:hypothetical protein